MTKYVQGRHNKKPVHICVSEKRERERERECMQTQSMWVMKEDQYTGKREKKRDTEKKRRVVHVHYLEEEE